MLIHTPRSLSASFVISFLAIFTHFCSPALAATLRIQISPSVLLPNPNILPASTHATLTSGDSNPPLQALLRKDNTIEFASITTAGSHLLDVYTRDYVFASYRIDITPSTDDKGETVISGAWETYKGVRWSDHGASLLPFSAQTQQTQPQVSLTIAPKVLGHKKFYEERQGFNPLQLLKNPMILMAVFALAFTFGMPKLMENMDPETKAEYEEMQKKSGMNKLTSAMIQGQQGGGAKGPEGFDLAGYLANASSSKKN